MAWLTDSVPYNILLIATVAGEFLLPFALKGRCPGYSAKRMAMSALGSRSSPVRGIYNAWLIWLGCFMLTAGIAYCGAAWAISRSVALLELLSIGIFAIGAGLMAGVFHVGDSKADKTLSAKLHGIGSAIGFMALMFLPLLEALRSFKAGEDLLGIADVAAFLLALACFTLFVMGDKERFRDTVIACEGLWERASLAAMYLPFIFRSAASILASLGH